MKQYQPLYLKYRPQKLSELIGQEVVTRTLSNAILYNKVVHAYLFCGPRGTGKTSCARILAKSLNCEKGITVDPCNKCVSCTSITNGSSLDVIEIDAASHRKVEDAEDLINRVSLGTYGSRFKIYIIDEVHMLTDHAFNALLKTLEEPPKNVIFILATTEEYKVISTIISRCQKLEFKPIAQDLIEEKIKQVAKEEKIIIDNITINFISKKSNGCLRDAISLLDQISVLQVDEKPINPKEVFDLFSSVDRGSLLNLLESLLIFDKTNTTCKLEELVKSGKDISELYKGLLEVTIDLAKAKIDQTYKQNLSLELNNNLEVLNKVETNHLLKIIDRLQEAESKLRFSFSQELHFIATILSMLDEDFLTPLKELKERIEHLENREEKGEGGEKREEPRHETIVESRDEPLHSPVKSHGSASTSNAIQPHDHDILWTKIINLIDSTPTKTLLLQSGSYLLSLTNEIIEIGLTKDIFLPRLEKDQKKKDMIIKAAKLTSGTEPKTIKYRVLPKPQELKTNTIASRTIIEDTSKKEGDNFTIAIEDLLGAKKLD